MRYDAEVVMYLTPDDSFRVKRSGWGLTCAELEAFYADLFAKMGCCPDGDNN